MVFSCVVILISVFSSLVVYRFVNFAKKFSIFSPKPIHIHRSRVSKQSLLWCVRFRETCLVFPWSRFQRFYTGKGENIQWQQRADNFKQVEKGLLVSNASVNSVSVCMTVCIPASTLSPPFPVVYLCHVAGGQTSYLNQSSFAGTGFLHLIFSLLSRSLKTDLVVVVRLSHSSRQAATMKVISVREASLLLCVCSCSFLKVHKSTKIKQIWKKKKDWRYYCNMVNKK